MFVSKSRFDEQQSRLTELATRASLFENVFETATSAQVVIDAKGKVLHQNAAYRELTDVLRQIGMTGPVARQAEIPSDRPLTVTEGNHRLVCRRTRLDGGLSLLTAELADDVEAPSLGGLDPVAVLAGAPVNVIACDLDLRVTWINSSAEAALRELQEYLPIRVDRMIGASIDMFHKHPAHQRQMLARLRSGSHKADIRLGPETLGLHVFPAVDATGVIAGYCLFWVNKTALVRKELEVSRLLFMLDNMPVNVMMTDPEEFRIVYVNETAKKTFKTIEHLLPIKADEMLGTSIDRFHKNPSHQRRLLADPANLPYQTQIALGDEKLELKASAVHDASGSYLGPMVTWAVVTQNVRFASHVTDVVSEVRQSAANISAASTALQEAADETNRLTASVSVVSQQSASNTQTVASAAEELTASIAEISRQIQESAAISRGAAEAARETDGLVDGLADMARRIGDVVGLIRNIAGQTNLLALNATIEAARAGDAGKGFAVVASEVKSLANQVTRATEDISVQVNEIQDKTRDAVAAIQRIGGFVGRIDEISTVIAAAAEEQSAATQEIARNVQSAAKGVAEVDAAIHRVAETTRRTERNAHGLTDDAGRLAGQSDVLQREVEIYIKMNSVSGGGGAVERERRMYARKRVDLDADVAWGGGKAARGRLVDLSIAGARFHPAPAMNVGDAGQLRIQGLTDALPCRVVSVRDDLHVQFDLEAARRAGIGRLLVG